MDFQLKLVFQSLGMDKKRRVQYLQRDESQYLVMKDLIRGNCVMQNMSMIANKTPVFHSYNVPEQYMITYKHVYLQNDNVTYKLSINFDRLKQFFIL